MYIGIRLVNDFQKQQEKELNYIEAKRAKEKFQILAKRYLFNHNILY